MTRVGSPTSSTSRSTYGISPTGSQKTSSTTSSPPTRAARPPTRACAATRRSSSPRWPLARLALGFDAVATGHYARLSDGRLRRAVDADKDQSYVLGGADRRAVAARDVPDRRHPQAADPRGGRPPRAGGRRQAGQPRHLLHPVGRHPGVPRRPNRRAARRGRRRRRNRARRARRRARLHHRSAQGPGHRGAGPGRAPRYVTAIDADTGTVHVGDVSDLDVWTLDRRAAGVHLRPCAAAGPSNARCRCARTAASPKASPNCVGEHLVVELRAALRGVAPGQTMVLYRPRRRTATRSSAARRSPPRPAEPGEARAEYLRPATPTPRWSLRWMRNAPVELGSSTTEGPVSSGSAPACSSSRCRTPSRETGRTSPRRAPPTSPGSRDRRRRCGVEGIRRWTSNRRRTWPVRGRRAVRRPDPTRPSNARRAVAGSR